MLIIPPWKFRYIVSSREQPAVIVLSFSPLKIKFHRDISLRKNACAGYIKFRDGRVELILTSWKRSLHFSLPALSSSFSLRLFIQPFQSGVLTLRFDEKINERIMVSPPSRMPVLDLPHSKLSRKQSHKTRGYRKMRKAFRE